MKRNLILLLLATFMGLIAFGQKVSRKSIKRSITEYPTLPVENVQKVAFQINFPDASVNQDVIRKYKGTMEILKSDGERVSKMKEYSYKPIEMVNEEYDLLVEVAFAKPMFRTKEAIFNETSKDYFYRIDHEMEAIVKISDANGKLLDIWSHDKSETIRFGSEQIEIAEKGSFSMQKLNYKSEAALQKGFNEFGKGLVNRKAILRKLRVIIEDFYPKIYFLDTKDDFSFGTGKGKDYDYSDLDGALETAIAIDYDGDLSKLDECIATWDKNLKEANLLDRKAKISKKVAAILNGNLAIAYLYKKDFAKAKEQVQSYVKLSKEIDARTTFQDAKQSSKLKMLINHREKSFKANGHLTPPSEKAKAFDFKKAIGRSSKNKSYNLFFNENKIDVFRPELESFLAKERASQTKKTVSGTATTSSSNKYEGKIVVTAGQGGMLALNTFYDSDIVGKEFPKEITQLVDLKQIIATGMKFSSLPDNIGDLKNLTKLALKGNNLTEIPESIGQLSELTTLNLGNNKLTTLPESIKKCTKLKTLVLKGNNDMSLDEIDKIQTWLPKKCKVKL